MIKSIKLKNWKSYKESVLYIDPLTIVIGTNASGKSNAIDALILLSRIASGVGIFQAISGDVTLDSLRGGIDWVCKKNTRSFTLTVIMEYENVDYEYSVTIEVGTAKALITEETLIQCGTKRQRLFYTNLSDNKLSDISTYFSTGKQGKGQTFALNRNTSILYQSKTLPLKKKETVEITTNLVKQLSGIFILDPIPNHMRDYSPLAEKLATDGSNIAGVLAALENEKKEEIQEKLTSYLRKIPEKDIERVWTERIGKFNTDAMLYCKEGWNEDECIVDARGMSDGTLRFLSIMVAMLTNETNQLIVVEEVDNGLHPSRAKILIDMLKELGHERNLDVLITTHNPALLDAAGTSMIPFITVAHRDEKGQSQLTLLEDIKNLPKMISMGNIGELATNGKIESALAREEK